MMQSCSRRVASILRQGLEWTNTCSDWSMACILQNFVSRDVHFTRKLHVHRSNCHRKHFHRYRTYNKFSKCCIRCNVQQSYLKFRSVSSNVRELCTQTVMTAAYKEKLPEAELSSDVQCLLFESEALACTDMDPVWVSQLVRDLVQTQYAAISHIPWLQKEPRVAYLQLLMQEELQWRMQPLHEHSLFVTLLDRIEQNASNFTDLPLLHTLLGLLTLGVDPTSAVIHRLYLQSLDGLHTLDMHSLYIMSSIFKTMNKSSSSWPIHKFLQRFQEVMSEMPSDMELCNYMLKILVSNWNKISPHAREVCTLKVMQTLHDTKTIEEPKYLSKLAQFGSRLFVTTTDGHVTDMAREVLKNVHAGCFLSIEKMNSRHIGEICSNMKRGKCFSRPLGKLFVNRSKSMLYKDISVADLSNLMFCLTSDTAFEDRRQFENLLYDKMDNLDVLITCNLAEVFLQMDLKNQDVIAKFQHKIVENQDKILAYMSRFHHIVRFVQNRKFYDSKLESEFMSKLQQGLEGQLGIDASRTAFATSCLLSSAHEPLPEYIYKDMLDRLPAWSLSHLCRLALSINANRAHQFQHPGFRRQVFQIRNMLYLGIMNKLDNLCNLMNLCQLTQTIVLLADHKDPILTDCLLQLYPLFTQNLNEATLNKVTQIFLMAKFSVREVMDNLVHFTMENHESLDTKVIFKVSALCATVNYQPKEAKRWEQVILKACATTRRSKKVYHELQALKQLCILNTFPERYLASTFTMEYMLMVDKNMTDCPHNRRQIEKLMMELNRCVVIEYPQLDVPWFHESYCQEHLAIEDDMASPRGNAITQEVRECLHHLVGDDDYFRCGVFSPYYWFLDFELVLDDEGKLVKLTDPKAEDGQRVALLLLSKNYFCYGSRQLVGEQAMKVRQLEVLGYKVVQIPHFEWHSMGLADTQARMDYITEKIFS